MRGCASRRRAVSLAAVAALGWPVAGACSRSARNTPTGRRAGWSAPTAWRWCPTTIGEAPHQAPAPATPQVLTRAEPRSGGRGGGAHRWTTTRPADMKRLERPSMGYFTVELGRQVVVARLEATRDREGWVTFGALYSTTPLEGEQLDDVLASLAEEGLIEAQD